MPENWCGIDYNRFTAKYRRVEIPTFRSKEQEIVWAAEQFDRFINGYGEMCGSTYFYYNFFYMTGVGGGLPFRPELRMTDDIWFRAEEKAEATRTGMCAIKRRRQGATWRCVARDLFKCITEPGYRVGFSSKGDHEAAQYVARFKLALNKLPIPLRPISQGADNRMQVEFKKVSRKGGRRHEDSDALNSSLIAKAPDSVNMWESETLTVLRQDEIGKLKFDIEEMADMSMPCLVGNDGFSRAGYAVFLGTAGNMGGRSGLQAADFYETCESRDLSKFFVPGYWGLVVDEFGNDDFDAGKKEVLSKYAKAKNREQEISIRQQYPLTEEDAFLDSSSSQIFPVKFIQKAEVELHKNPPRIDSGFFSQERDGRVIFNPHPDGKVRILEHPTGTHVEDRYCSGADPIDHDLNVEKKAAMKMESKLSKGAWVVVKAAPESPEDYSSDYPKVVCTYADRPDNVRDYYRQVAYGCLYFGCQVMIEYNRGAMMGFFKEWGLTRMLAKGKSSLSKKIDVQHQTYGYKKDTQGNFDEYINKLIAEDLEYNTELYKFVEILEDLRRANKRSNADYHSALQGAWHHYYGAHLRRHDRLRTLRQSEVLFGNSASASDDPSKEPLMTRKVGKKKFASPGYVKGPDGLTYRNFE